jgi:hypothetical protein
VYPSIFSSDRYSGSGRNLAILRKRCVRVALPYRMTMVLLGRIHLIV